jgi:hypothetical protein
MSEVCDRCNSPLMEIDHYGDRLTGCLKCNVWRGKQLVIQLPDEDLEALRGLDLNPANSQGQREDRNESFLGVSPLRCTAGEENTD